MPRLLIVDDNSSIHQDFAKVLQPQTPDRLRSVEAELFGDDDPDFAPPNEPIIDYAIDNAFQGEEAIEMADLAAEQGSPYSLIFMDVRMPPGIDGVKAASAIWKRHPLTEIVICSAHSDYTWSDIVREFGATDKLQFLRKPFDMVSVQQLALSCTKKWELELEYKSNEDIFTAERAKVHQGLDKALMSLSEIRQALLDARGHVVEAEVQRRLDAIGSSLAQTTRRLREIDPVGGKASQDD